MPRRQRTDPPAAPPAGTDSSDSSAPATPASGTSTSRPSGPRSAGRRKPPPPTVVLLVRHGATTTTGKELPGRAPGLHLSEVGRQQAESVAAHIAALAGLSVDGAARNGASDTPDDAAATVAGDARADGRRRRPTSRSQGQARGRSRDRGRGLTIAAVYSSPLERTRETAAPIADVLGLDVTVDDGLLELDVGDWTGLELKAARKRREWTTIQRYPSGFAFPGGESFVAMQSRITSTLDRLRAAHAGEAIVAVSHADPIRAAVNHAVGAHLDMFQRVVVSPCSLTAIAYGTDGPTVLTVNDTGATGALVAS
jgi:broad specificity phosphatase PhoE